MGHWEIAAKYYRDALQHDPNNPPVWVNYARTLREAGRLPEAEAAYRTALSYAEQQPELHLELAHLLKSQANASEEQRARVMEAVREALAQFQTPRGLEAPAAAWIVTAKR